MPDPAHTAPYTQRHAAAASAASRRHKRRGQAQRDARRTADSDGCDRTAGAMPAASAPSPSAHGAAPSSEGIERAPPCARMRAIIVSGVLRLGGATTLSSYAICAHSERRAARCGVGGARGARPAAHTLSRSSLACARVPSSAFAATTALSSLSLVARGCGGGGVPARWGSRGPKRRAGRGGLPRRRPPGSAARSGRTGKRAAPQNPVRARRAVRWARGGQPSGRP
eukprot:1590656-Prymnesium_polylepis.2